MDKENAPQQKRRCMRVGGDTLAKLSNLSTLSSRFSSNCELDEVMGEVAINDMKMIVNASKYESILGKEWRLLLPCIALQFPVVTYTTHAAPSQLSSLNIKKSEVIVADNSTNADKDDNCMQINMTIEVEQYLTKGSFGHIYVGYVTNNDAAGNWIDKKVVIKVDKNIASVVWECYIHTLLKHRSDATDSSIYNSHYLEPVCLMLYSNVSVMCMEYAVHGTLHDIIMELSKQRLSVKDHEHVCLYFTNDMMLVLGHLHQHHIIHSDIKTNNWVVKKDPVTDKLILMLIDFGKAKDVMATRDQPTIRYTGSSSASGYKCPAMLDGSHWSFEADYYSALACIHQLLYYQPMYTITRVSIDEVKRFGYNYDTRIAGPYIIPTTAIKRYWNRNLWSALYYTLLNESNMSSSTQAVRQMIKAHISLYNVSITDALRVLTNCLQKI